MDDLDRTSVMSSLHGSMVTDDSIQVESGLLNRIGQLSLAAKLGAIAGHCSIAHLTAHRVTRTKVSLGYVV